MEEQTINEYRKVIAACKELFVQKTKDYGTAWRILRLPSVTDQILIKAKRIRSIQESGIQKVAEGIRDEFVGVINYSIMAMIQQKYVNGDKCTELLVDKAITYYDQFAKETRELLVNKNHDYGEAWKDMRLSSITDIILMKLLRIKQIEDNQGKTLVSEGVKANYQDVINYAVFCLIKLDNASFSVKE